ncbi:glycosyltransferase family 2 protein [Microbacterium aurantiacum]|uniref:glycosyltransferase family 2 protein n=1 Tax=Microbacterium aurantiacum TaxID=162393 RepID=UPI001FEBB2AB|nr:glycosyltransferase [Microbacterium aurantiacum]
MSDSSARVGIVVRTKDRPTLLARALDDIVGQSFSAWHVVIVNDGGDSDALVALVDSLDEQVRAKVSVIDHDVSLGRSAAANAGVSSLSTEYVVLHDDDDLWDADFLALSVEWLDRTPADIGVVSRTDIVYERFDGERFVETDREPFWAKMKQISYADLLQVNRFVPIAYVYRRVVHDEVGLYRVDIHAAEDWEFNLRVCRKYPIGFIDGPARAFWMQRRDVTGALGNSMFVLAAEHEYYDRLIRDEALRAFTTAHGDGLALYLARFIQEEVGRQLDARRSIGDRLISRIRGRGNRAAR